jgi:cache domain-containing protein
MQKVNVLLNFRKVIIIALLIPLFLAGTSFAEKSRKDENFADISFEMDIALMGLKSLSEAHLLMVRDNLKILAMTSEVKSCDWKRMKPLLAASEKLSIPCVYWFANPDASYYTVDKDKTDKSLKDRDYFPKLLEGKEIFGSLVVSHSTGKKAAIIAVPIKKDTKVVGMLGTSVFLEDLNELLKKEMAFTDDVVFFALDEKGETVLNWKTDRIFKYPAKMGDISLADAIDNMMKVDVGIVEYSYKEKKRKIKFIKSKITDWRFALGWLKN